MRLAVIIPVYNGSKLLADTLQAVRSGIRAPDELFVVDDASVDDSAAIAASFGASVLRMPQNVGPAACRNHAALLTDCELLVFMDADTCPHPDTLSRIEARFDEDSQLGAVIGAYDDTPKDPGLVSQYRNLAHCYVHRHAHRKALTFWSGCGAVRREIFLEIGGFDEHFRRPSIEDIEFGYLMSDRGIRILLDPAICVTHTKHWTVWNSIVTDVVNRGTPWTALLLERKKIPDDLNIKKRHRLAAAMTGVALLCLVPATRSPEWLIPCFILLAASACADFGLLRFMYSKGGLPLLAVATSMTLLQNVCKLVSFFTGAVAYAFRLHPAGRERRARRSQVLEYRGKVRQQLAVDPVSESER